MATVVKRKNLKADLEYEPPLNIGFGLNTETCEDTVLTMGHTIIPPGGRNQRHYHKNTAAGMYIMKGRLRIFVGPDIDLQEIDVEPGDFVYAPRGEIHGLLNLSDTEPAELIFTYSSARNKKEAGTIYIEKPWKK
jgi:uncharacterized RmlC-like cupin family protein